MKLLNCNFETWAENHTPEHKDRIYRELYPYKIFEKIDFNSTLVGKEHNIKFNNIDYFVELNKIELQENQRYKATFSLDTVTKSNRQSWKQRLWYETFQIIYTKDFHFITVYTKNEDSSKIYLKNYFKGNFDLINQKKIYTNFGFTI